MPWKEVTSMEAITRFVMLAQSDRFTITELCEQFGISRKTGYKHLERYAASGLKGLQERSHRPHHFPQLTVRQAGLRCRREDSWQVYHVICVYIRHTLPAWQR
jgi:transposase